MAQLVPIQLEDGSEIYIEAEDGVELSPTIEETEPTEMEPEETVRGGQKGFPEFGSRGFSNLPGGGSGGSGQKTAAAIAAQSFKAIEGTIRTYTSQTLKSFKNMGNSDIHKVTLQFGITVGGEAGVPYVTKGTAESNLSITVECVFDSEK
ncbi:MAG: CU044_2847 family protein [Phormidesmis sp.]